MSELKKILLAIGLVVVILLAGAGGYWLALKNIHQKTVAAVPENNETLSPISNSNTAPTSSVSSSDSVQMPYTTYNPKIVTLPPELINSIEWQDPAPTAGLNLFVDELSASQNSTEPPTEYNQFSYYVVGRYSYQNKTGRILYVSGIPEPGGPPKYLIAEYNGQYVILIKYSTPDLEGYQQVSESDVKAYAYATSSVAVDMDSVIPVFNFPAAISSTQPGQILNRYAVIGYQKESFYNLPGQNFLPIFHDNTWGDVYTSTSTAGFYLFGPHRLYLASYSIVPNFFPANSSVPQITWQDGTKNKDEYTVAHLGGCGFANFATVVSTSTIDPSKDLEVIGKNINGEAIYGLVDHNSKILKTAFDQAYDPTGKLTYANYLAIRPLIYWIDPFGRLIQLETKKFVTPAECGKPVIYLYPTETTNVSVKLAPQGGFSYSEPSYIDGWNVVAEPSGKLTNISDNKTYPYLFWEGRGGLYNIPDLGWVVKNSEVKSLITAKLKLFNLNDQEISDFEDFWLPKFGASPYYFITFMGNRVMDKIAPLNITPKPDTVIRVLMDFAPLDKPISVKGFEIKAPARTGFTVVEWGGVLH